MNRILKCLSIIICTVLLFGCTTSSEDDKDIKIVATSFPGYDAARAIVGTSDDVSVKMLLKPGSETHDFEPTPKDIVDISKSDVFIYVGGESDTWVESIINNIDTNKTKIIKLTNLVDLKKEEIIVGMESDEESDEYDEHIWTSPINEIKIIDGLKNAIIEVDSEHKSKYEENANRYISELNDIDIEIRNIVSNAKRKELIFADRFPFRYFVDEYGLDYYAAFPGCSDATEASAKTIAFLIDKVKSDNIPVIFHIELSSGNIAEAIKEQTDVKILELHSMHNISLKDFNRGATYLDIMRNNIEALREALM